MHEKDAKMMEKTREMSDSFSYGSNSAKGTGVLKIYFDASKTEEEIQKHLEKALKILSWMNAKGYCKAQV